MDSLHGRRNFHWLFLACEFLLCHEILHPPVKSHCSISKSDGRDHHRYHGHENSPLKLHQLGEVGGEISEQEGGDADEVRHQSEAHVAQLELGERGALLVGSHADDDAAHAGEHGQNHRHQAGDGVRKREVRVAHHDFDGDHRDQAQSDAAKRHRLQQPVQLDKLVVLPTPRQYTLRKENEETLRHENEILKTYNKFGFRMHGDYFTCVLCINSLEI